MDLAALYPCKTFMESGNEEVHRGRRLIQNVI